ncbi:MAG: sensor histidine kinase, partial [Oscillospiraceae bacterium]
KLEISIEDDGVGMCAEQVEQINWQLSQERKDFNPGSSIGIQNVNRRIKLSCGDEYGVSVTSSPRTGSRFMITLPTIVKEENHDNPNC